MKKPNKKVLLCVLAALLLLLAAVGLWFGLSAGDVPDTDPGQTEQEKQPAAAVTDLSVTPGGIATFTHVEGLQYQLLIDGNAVTSGGIGQQYDIYPYVCDGAEHTVTVRSLENDTYLQSDESNAVRVRVVDASGTALTYDRQTYTFSFNEEAGYTYHLLVNGRQQPIPADRCIRDLIPYQETVIIDLAVCAPQDGEVVLLDARLNILTVTYHPQLTDLTLENAILTFSELPGFTYTLYSGQEQVLENVSSGMNIEQLLKTVTGASASFSLHITGDAQQDCYVLAENGVSNTVTAYFLQKPTIAVSQAGGRISLKIFDTANAGISGVYYQVFVNGEVKGTVTKKLSDISELFTEAGTVMLHVQAMADGYYSYNSSSTAARVVVPDYNRFHYTYDAAQATVGGLVSDNRASITVSASGLSIQTDVTVDLTRADLHKTLIAIENPSDYPAGILSLQVDIVSSADPSKFIRINVASSNGYNTHVYGGYGDDLLGSVRSNHDLVDAAYGQIVDYNILWSAFMLGSVEGAYGYTGWDTTQKMPLVLVYDSGKLGYFSPDGQLVPIIDLRAAEGFSVSDFSSATLRYTIGEVKAGTATGFGNATYTLDFFGTGTDLSDDYFIGRSGLKLKSLENNATNGVYLFVAPFNTADVAQGTEEWIAMGGTLTTGKLTINGVPHELVIKYSGEKNRLYIDFGEYNSLFNAAAFLGETMYITLPSDATLTGDWKGAVTWNMLTSYTICSTPSGGQFGQWQLCTHDHTNGLPDTDKLPDRVSATLNSEQTSQSYIGFTMSQYNGFEADNWDEFITVPDGALYNANALQLKRAGGGTSFYVEGSDKASPGDILVFPAGEYYNSTTGKGITLSTTYRLKWSGSAWLPTDETYTPPVTPDRVSATLNSEQTSQSYIGFTMSQYNGFEADNWDEFITVPDGALYNESPLQLKRAGGGTSFYVEGSDKASPGDILVFPAGDYYNGTTGKGITLSATYRLKWSGSAWVPTDETYTPPAAPDRVPATINGEQTNKNYIGFTMSQYNGFEADNWDVFVTVPDGALYNASPLQLKRAGGGTSFYVEGSGQASVGDVLTFAPGDYYNPETGKGITLSQQYCLKWTGSAWLPTDGYTPPEADLNVTLSQTVKRNWWWGFEMFLEGTGLTVGPQNGTVSIDGEVLLDGQVMSDPWFVVSDYNWGTGSYPIIIKTSDHVLWADEAAYNADKAAGTVHQFTVRAGTKLTTSDGVTYTVTEDASYRISTVDGTYKWRYTTEEYEAAGAAPVEVTLGQNMRRSWWWGFELFLDGTDLAVGPQNGTVSIDGEVLLDGQVMSDPWFVVSDYNWGTGSYPIIIKTSDHVLWADEAAYNADKAAGTVHQFTVRAGTKLTTSDGVTYTVTEDASYRISTVDGTYKWRYTTEDYTAQTLSTRQTVRSWGSTAIVQRLQSSYEKLKKLVNTWHLA